MTISMKIAAFDGKAATERDDREAAAMHVILNGLRSKLALEDSVDEDGPSDAEAMEAIENGLGTERSGPNRFRRAT